MAVEDKYTDANIEAGKLTNNAFAHGAKLFCMVGTEETAVADDDGSKYRFFKNINPELIPVEIKIYHDTITSGTDYDLGLYETSEPGVDGAVISADVFLDGGNLTSGVTKAAPLDGMTNVDVANLQKKIWEHAGHTLSTRKTGYDIVLTANTVGSAIGTITIVAWFVQG